jgi:hypothetical protein
MRVVVSGSRGITDQPVVYRILTRHLRPAIDVAVHGACKDGVDSLVKEFCEERKITQDPFPVSREEWNRLGKKAGPLRNRRMLEKAEKLVAIWDGKSPGTRSTIRAAVELRMEMHIYFFGDVVKHERNRPH